MREWQYDEFLPRMQELLSQGKSVKILPGGISMLPTFRPEQDIVILSPVPARLKKYDVPFYRRKSGQLVLHRIVAVKGNTYTMLGDSQLSKEPGVTRDQMIGVVSGFIRDGKEHSVKEPGYWLYCRFWHHTRRLRHMITCPEYYVRRIRKCLKLKP